MNKPEIKKHFQENKEEINSRLSDFKKLRDSSEERKFQELVFVILTSQSTAKDSWNAVKDLESKEVLLSNEKQVIQNILEENQISYPDNKAEYIIENQKFLSQPTLQNPESSIKISQRINEENLDSTRTWLVENIKGIRWKGASHFLRNIGYGDDFAIISKPILSQLYDLGLTKSLEPPKNKQEYTELEDKIKKFSEDISIETQALDLVLWSMKTGEIFK